MNRQDRSQGFTLIELLIAVAIIGIIAAIALPSLNNALDRGRQKRSMADLRGLANGIEQYSIDHGRYPVVTDITALAGVVEPDYIKVVPRTDGWGMNFYVASDAERYTLGSCGKGATACSSISVTANGGTGGPTGDFSDDIVLALGSFIQWPEGQQR